MMYDELLKRLNERLQGISTPLMNGDNLATILCLHFCDGEDYSDHDSGWSKAAVDGCDETISAIQSHCEPLAHELSRLQARVKELEIENSDLKTSVVAFAGPWAAVYATLHGLGKNELHPVHYDLLKKCGARMVEFRRAAVKGDT